MRAPRAVVLAAGIGFGVLTLVIAREEPAFSFAGTSAWRALLELTAGWALLVVGVVGSAWRADMRLWSVVALPFGWFLVEWNNPGIGSAVGFALGLSFYAVAPPLAAHVGLAYPSGRVSSPLDQLGLGVSYIGGLLVLGVAPALVYDPAASGCGECPRNLLLVHDSPQLYERLNRVGIYAGLASSLALILLLGLRLVRVTPALRRVVWPVAVSAAAFLGFAAWDFAHSLSRGTLGTDTTDRNLWLGEGGALVALAGGVAWSWVLARRTRAALARLVVELSESPKPGGLRELLAGSLRDPSLELAYPLGDGTLVDASGHPTSLDGEVTPLVRGDEQVALLAHRPGLLDDPGLVEEVAVAARLALENERLQAESRARLEELRASRARVIATGDAERRRLERDLHDGAQQRLVALSLALRLGRSRLFGADPALVARLDEADAELRAALGELRELAHGIFPAILADEGLAAALETLVEEAPIPIEIEAIPDERLGAQVESTAYFVVVETLRQSRPAHARIAARCADRRLTVDVITDGPLQDVIALEDRVGALDGTLDILRGPNGARIHVEIPCAS